jgi:hypothetical protein
MEEALLLLTAFALSPHDAEGIWRTEVDAVRHDPGRAYDVILWMTTIAELLLRDFANTRSLSTEAALQMLAPALQQFADAQDAGNATGTAS